MIIYQFWKPNYSNLKFDEALQSDTLHIWAYNLKIKAKFQNDTDGFGHLIVDEVYQISRLYDLSPAQSICFKMAKLQQIFALVENLTPKMTVTSRQMKFVSHNLHMDKEEPASSFALYESLSR